LNATPNYRRASELSLVVGCHGPAGSQNPASPSPAKSLSSFDPMSCPEHMCTHHRVIAPVFASTKSTRSVGSLHILSKEPDHQGLQKAQLLWPEGTPCSLQ